MPKNSCVQLYKWFLFCGHVWSVLSYALGEATYLQGAQLRFKRWGVRILSVRDLRAEPEKERGRGLWRGLVSPSPDFFWKFELQIVQFGVYFEREILKQSTFQRKHRKTKTFLFAR